MVAAVVLAAVPLVAMQTQKAVVQPHGRAFLTRVEGYEATKFQLWRPDPLSPRAEYPGTDVCWSRDGSWFAVLGRDDKVAIIDSTTLATRRTVTFPGYSHPQLVGSSEDSGRLVVHALIIGPMLPAVLLEVRVADGEIRAEPGPEIGLNRTARLALDPTDRWVTLVYYDAFALWDRREHAFVRSPCPRAHAVAFSADGAQLALSCGTGVQLFDARRDFSPIRSLDLPALSSASELQFSPRGDRLFVNWHAAAADVTTGKSVRLPSPHRAAVLLDWGEDGLLYGLPNRLVVVDPVTGAERSSATPLVRALNKALAAESQGDEVVRKSSRGAWAVADSGSLRFWDGHRDHEVRLPTLTAVGESSTYRTLAFSPDGTRLLAGSCGEAFGRRGDTVLFDVRQGLRPIGRWRVDSCAPVWIGRDEYVASGELRRASTGTVLRRGGGSHSPAGRHFYTLENGHLIVKSVKTGAVELTAECHDYPFFSRDDAYLAFTAEDGPVVYRLNDARRVLSVSRDEARVDCCPFRVGDTSLLLRAPFSSRIYRLSDGKSLDLYETGDGRLLGGEAPLREFLRP